MPADNVAADFMPAEAFGFINAFKPPGLTSTAFGSWVRHRLGGVSIGHWGTLDPLACGVLVLAVGKAARLLPLIAPTTKRYVFELVVGERTDSADASGEVIERATPPGDWVQRLRGAAASMIGTVEQIPPMFSAVKVEGRPLHRFARAGQAIRRTARRVKIHDLCVLGEQGAAARLAVECDAGTYIRTLCEQLGERIGVPARMGSLVRTQAGPFRLNEASLPRDITEDPHRCIIDPADVLTMPHVAIGADCADRFLHGNQVALERDRAALDRHEENHREPIGESLVLLNRRIIGTAKIVRVDGVEWLAPTRVLT